MSPHPAVPFSLRTRIGAITLASAILAVAAVPSPVTAADPLLTLPKIPWFVGQNVAPNILLTLDDSGSMAWGYLPDDLDKVTGSETIAFKSTLNPMYYNPASVYTVPSDANGQPYSTSFTRALRNGFDPSRGTVDLSNAYRPERYYTPCHDGTEDSRCSDFDHLETRFAAHCPDSQLTPDGRCPGVGVAPRAPTGAYTWVYEPRGRAICPAAPTFEALGSLPAACFALHRPGAGTSGSNAEQERQNFANWYSFYRTRNLSAVSATMRGLAELPPDYRIGWQALSSCASTHFAAPCLGWDRNPARAVDASIGPFDAAKRQTLWRWLERLPAQGETPLREAVRRAGEYLELRGAKSPFADDPKATRGVKYTSCRAAYHVMMTDGVWNGSSASIGNIDGASRTLPDGRSYVPRAPFRDTNVDSVADLSFYYWSRDLQPGLNDTVRPSMPFQAGLQPTDAEYWDPRNDPATWQRMTSIHIGFGLSQYLQAPVKWLGSTYAGEQDPATGFQRFAQGLAQWPIAQPDSQEGNVYDLWHGAINSRGAFYAADSPRDLVKAFEEMRNRISASEAGASGVASASLQVQTDSMMFSTSFGSRRWDGTLRAFKIQSDGVPESTPAWSTDTTFNALPKGDISRHMVYARAENGALVRLWPGKLSPLPREVRLSLADQAEELSRSLTRKIGAPDLVRWVLGQSDYTELRQRDRLLGDLVNSAPLYEGARDYGYSVTAWTDEKRIDGQVYAQYLKEKLNPTTNRPRYPTVYVGSNDGMLHAFDADSGRHRWAYMPTPSFAKLGKRADPRAGHEWFVDGPIVTHDIHDGNAWRTILVASPGAGARGLFALDVTDPTRPTLLWEYFPDDDDLGHVLGEPVVARAESGEWIVAFGNGYGHPSNKALLYVLDARRGTLISKMATGAQSSTVANGLAAPALLYTAGKRLAYAYAGDLLGNVWRFKLGGTSAREWKLDFDSQPLFSATGPDGKPQPITAKIRIASDRQLGRMLLFGTGRLLAQTDPTLTTKQSIYGVRDRPDGATTATRADLGEQRIISESGTLRTLSQNATPVGGAGWFLDLDGRPSNVGERVTMPVNYMPELSLMTVTTIQPGSAEDPCDTRTTSWVMTLSPFSGQGVALFSDGASRGAAARFENMLAAPTPIRMSGGRVQLTFNAGRRGLSQVEIKRGWNPRAAWTQVR